MKSTVRNVTLTNVTDKQYRWLLSRARVEGVPISGMVKNWINDSILGEEALIAARRKNKS